MPKPVTYPPFTRKSTYPSPLAPDIDLMALLPPPETAAPPRPKRPELAPPPAGWTRSLHASPAAYPRELRDHTGNLSRSSTPFRVAVPPNETKAGQKERIAEGTHELAVARYGSHVEKTPEEGVAAGQPLLFQSVERWRRDKPSGRGKTLVLTHANGLPKEQWQPVLRNLLARNPDTTTTEFGTGEPLPPAHIEIDDIWMLDEASSGQSVDLNAGHMGPAQAWRDVGRDVLNFVQHILPAAKDSDTFVLPWAAEGTKPAVKVVGIGHSFGGNAQVQAAAKRPDLFESLFLVDPMCPPHIIARDPGEYRAVEGYQLSAVTLKRRNGWKDINDARENMAKSAFYKSWNKDAFEIWLTHGLVDDGKQIVLATPPWSEAAIFCEPDGFARGWDMLPNLPMPVGFILERAAIATLGEEKTNEMVWRAPRSRNERFMNAGHLITQEQPDDTADALWRFLATVETGRWPSGVPQARM